MTLTRKVLWLALASCFSAILFGQTNTATIRGIVLDSSEAAVPAAKVIVTDVDRNTERRTETDTLGRYVLTALPPGTYTLSVEASGFQKYQRTAFRLDVQQQATVDVRLQVGEVTTSVKVESAAPLLNTTSANLGQVIDNRYVDSLPMLNRNVMLLTFLTPGVVGVGGGYYSNEGTNFSAVGTRNSTAEIVLDGQTTSMPEHNSGITTISHSSSVESIEEFKVQTSFFSAEFGNTGGAIVNMITKSGTNKFHGSGYWYYRNAVLNANSFFSNRAGSARPDYHRHLYGATVGGPIIKNKTFGFFSYERLPQGEPVNTTATFPTLPERQGDFSDQLLNGQQMNIFNPFDTFTNAAGDVKRRPFPNNVIPKSMMDPIALKAASYYPDPNQPGITNNWYNTGVLNSVNAQIEVKADHNFTEKDRLTGRYTWRNAHYVSPAVFGEGHAGIPWEYGKVLVGAKNYGLDYTRAHSAHTVVNVRFGVLTSYFDAKQLMQFDLRTLGLPGYMYDTALKFNQFGDIFPRFAPAGYTEIGNAGWRQIDRKPKTYQTIGNVTRIAGGHNLKVGGEYRREYLTYLQPNNPAGAFSFSRQTTSQDRFTANTLEGNGFASMLLGWGGGGSFDHTPFSFSNDALLAGYVQDEWKVTRRLTLNLGLRYERPLPRWEDQYRESFWNLNAPSPLAGKVPNMPNLHGYLDFNTKENRSPFNADTNNFAPRIGFAYAIDDKTSIRAGYALFYTLSNAVLTGNLGLGFTSSSGVEWSRDSNLTQYAHLSNPFPDGLSLPIGRSQGANSYLGLGIGAPTRDSINPKYHSWTFSIQRQLPGANLLEVNYTATKGVNQYVPITNLNMLDKMYWGKGRTALNALVPNPFYGVITDPKSSLSLPTTQLYRLYLPYPQYTGASRANDPAAGDTQYQSVQFKFERRFSHGLAMLAHYTISKAIDDVGGGSGNWTWLGGGSTSMQDVYNLRNERALSPNDIPQRLVLTFSYDLPIGTGKALGTDWGRVANALLGGWQIGGFMTFQSGAPLQVSQSSGAIWNGTQRPNLIGDPNPGGSVLDRLNANAYYNVAAFSKPPEDVPGTAPRLLNYRGPGIRNADMSMLKAFTVREGMRGEIRFETQNLTNTPAFGGPSSSFGSTTFGRITSYKSNLGPRACQVGLKFRF